jgi:hypothetical protein
LLQLLENIRLATRGDEVEQLAVERPNTRLIGIAQADRPLDHGVEHRREIAGRGIDDLQYLGGGGLLLERLVTLGSAFGKLSLQIGYELFAIG